jgi:hypothetical protein
VTAVIEKQDGHINCILSVLEQAFSRTKEEAIGLVVVSLSERFHGWRIATIDAMTPSVETLRQALAAAEAEERDR